MIRLRQHVPAYVDGVELLVAEAATTEELLKTPWVAERYGGDNEWVRILTREEARAKGVAPEFYNYWSNKGDGFQQYVGVQYCLRGMRSFYRFSVSDGKLMVEHDEGRYWWVVGYLSGDPVDLPQWVPVR